MLGALIAGGGVAGLEAALTLKANGLSVRLLEASEKRRRRRLSAFAQRVSSGSAPRPCARDGALLQARCRDFDLPLQRVGAGSARRKGVLTAAGLTYLAGPGDLMRSRLLSVKGKLRALAEPLRTRGTTPTSRCARSGAPTGRRAERLGSAADGVGSTRRPRNRLAVRTAFPRIWSMERHGGLIRSLYDRLAGHRLAARWSPARSPVATPSGWRPRS